MRLKLPREFYLPKNAKQLDNYSTDATVYVYDGARQDGRLYYAAIGFAGKAQKPTFNYTWSKEEKRAEYIAGFFSGRKEVAERVAKVQAERKAWVNPVVVQFENQRPRVLRRTMT